MKKFTFYFQTEQNTISERTLTCSNQGKAIAMFKRQFGKCKIVKIVKNNVDANLDNQND